MACTESLLLVDGHAYAYRSFHAIRQLTSPSGQPTNAIFGFLKSVSKLRATLLPTHIAVVWDGGLAAERMALLPEYKADRPPMPPALAEQLDQMMAWLAACGVATLCEDGIEADDRIASLTRQASAASLRVVIASSDKDFMQLVGPLVGLFNPNEATGAVCTAPDVRAKTGVEPEQIVDWLSLTGDQVDNIPGVPGVGPKTATALLRRFATCDRLFAELAQVEPERLRVSLRSCAETVRRNQQMIRLKADLPETLALERLRPGAEDTARLRELYARWGFKSLLAALERRPSAQGLLFS
jgi:DNA polymerase-1